MEPLLSLPPDQFRAALAELQLDPQREADLVRQYRRANSPLAPIFGLLDRVAGQDAGQGMQRASMVPVARPEGMSVAEAVRSGEARLAVPQGVLDAIGALVGGIDAPGAAARGLIPAQDMPAEALGTAGVAMGGGGLLSRPAGSFGMGGRVAVETPAQRVARLLREGRASEVTDDLMAQADPQEMYRLYVAGETGMDLPMDEASRMARAREMGFTNEAYHGASADFQSIDPEMASEKTYGTGIWFTDNPDVAATYAGGIYDSGQTYPSLLNTENFASSDWRGRSWGDAREGTRMAFPEQYGRPSRRIGDIYEDWASWPSTDSAARAVNQGELSGLRISDVVDIGPNIFNRADLQKRLPETAESIAVFDPRVVRSRFARFDPRLSHLANLNAANVSPIAGLLAILQAQEQQR